MNTLIEVLLNGVLLGSLYAMFALGLSLSLGVMKMINLAHGDLIVLGAYLAMVVMSTTGWSALASLALVLPAMFCIGWLLQTTLLNRVVGAHELSPLLVTFGLSVVIQNLLQEVFSADTRSGAHISERLAGGTKTTLVTAVQIWERPPGQAPILQGITLRLLLGDSNVRGHGFNRRLVCRLNRAYGLQLPLAVRPHVHEDRKVQVERTLRTAEMQRLAAIPPTAPGVALLARQAGMAPGRQPEGRTGSWRGHAGIAA